MKQKNYDTIIYIAIILTLILWITVSIMNTNANCRTQTNSGVHWPNCTEMSPIINIIYGILLTITVLASVILIMVIVFKLYFNQ